jgi:hypothetical protein
MKQASTAIAVYHESIEPTLQARQVFVREQLVQFIQQVGLHPTALELLRFIASQHPQHRFDANSVRPRLTEMHAQGWVEHSGKRTCAVTGKLVLTWRPSTPRVPLPDPIPQRLTF